MGDYRKLEAWASSRVLAVAVYRLTDTFPGRERFGLTDQMRRAAVSVVSNIAEGSGRGSDREFARFLRIARGSVHELQAQLVLATDLGFIQPVDAHAVNDVADQAGRKIHGLIRRYGHAP